MGSGLTGRELEECFGNGFSSVKAIVGYNSWDLSIPAVDVRDSSVDVTEQDKRAEVRFTPKTGELALRASPDGNGLWIPYLGNGTGSMGAKGWGTYSKVVNDASWVATGPFSGCYVAAFQGGGYRFAHLITPAQGYTAASVEAQVRAIESATRSQLHAQWPMWGAGFGLAFFLKLGAVWHRRFVWVGPGGRVLQMNATSRPI